MITTTQASARSTGPRHPLDPNTQTSAYPSMRPGAVALVRASGIRCATPVGSHRREPALAAGQRAALQVRLTTRRSAVQAATDAQRQLHALVVAAPDALRGRLWV
jgi:hypothetical protein